jgi:hypothetical protein
VSKEQSHQQGRLHAFFEEILKAFCRPAPKVPDGLTGEALAQWLREQRFVEADAIAQPAAVACRARNL